MGAKKLTTSDIIILAGGGLMLIASFLPFYSISFRGASESFSAWSKEGFFPIGWFAMLFGLAMAGQVAVSKLTSTSVPGRVAGLAWDQVHLALATFAALTMVAFLIQSTPAGLDKGAGQWLMLLASIALVVGSVMRTKEVPLSGGSGPTPPAPF